ncbi:MAG: hypothetical protein FJW96_05765 [Actinobacteria bacterium]|nr:hypothetical protein [Actinomycetota bacterium]
MARVAVMLLFALPLAAADLALKEAMPTEAWALHQRSIPWLLMCCVVLVGLVAVCRVPSRLVPVAAGILAAGVVGNGASALANGLVVPNPLLIEGDSTVIAYNLADVWAVAGILFLTGVLATWMIRNRHLFPSRTARSAARAKAAVEDGEAIF